MNRIISKDALDHTATQVPGKTILYPSFTNKYLHNRNPDINDYMLTHGKGEFSPNVEMNFDKHLKTLKKAF